MNARRIISDNIDDKVCNNNNILAAALDNEDEEQRKNNSFTVLLLLPMLLLCLHSYRVAQIKLSCSWHVFVGWFFFYSLVFKLLFRVFIRYEHKSAR